MAEPGVSEGVAKYLEMLVQHRAMFALLCWHFKDALTDEERKVCLYPCEYVLRLEFDAQHIGK